MSKKLHLDMAAEREADEIGQKFRNSSDVVGDMSRAYGADLSSVKIHTDSGAADMVAQQGVDAFSTGTDVFFGRGAFNPGNADSRGLLAHELAHSLQQGVGGGMGAVQQSAPLGAAQGGWLSNLFRGKKKKKNQEEELVISDVLGAEKDTSSEAAAHMARNTVFEPKRGGTLNHDKIDDFINSFGLDSGNGLSYLEASNRSYQKTVDENGKKILEGKRRADAYVNLGMRMDQNKSAIAEKAMRGDLYSGLIDDYADMMKYLGENGVDFTKVKAEGKINSAIQDIGGSIDKLTYAEGEGYEDLLGKVVTMFGKRFLSDESLDYVDVFHNAIGNADVFGGEKYGMTGVSGYALQHMMSTVGGNMTQLAKNEKLKSTPNAGVVGYNVGRAMGSLPKLAMMPEDKVPENMRSLRLRYLQLQDELDNKLRARDKKSG